MRWKIIIVNLLSIILILSVTSVSKADTVGIDVSRWQGAIDWSTVRGYAGFAIIKAGGSDGELYVDSQFYRNRDEARRFAIPRGYYYYAGGGNPVQEAEHFASIVGPLQPGEVVAMDFEIDHPDPVGYSLQFLVRTEQLLGAKPLLYTYMNKVWSNNWQPVVNNGNQLWGAIYDENPVNMPASGAWPGVMIKQYTSSGEVPGISANAVDLNIFKHSVEDFLSLGFTPKPQPAPPQIDVNYGLQEITETMLPESEASSSEAPAGAVTEPSADVEIPQAATEGIESETILLDGTSEEVRSERLDGQMTSGGKIAAAGGNEVASLDPKTPIGSVVSGVLFPLKQIISVASGDDDSSGQPEASGDNAAVDADEHASGNGKGSPEQHEPKGGGEVSKKDNPSKGNEGNSAKH